MGQVTDFFSRLFGTESWPARWYCGKWTDFHGWLYIASDLVIWSSYFTIPLILFYFVRRREQIPFRGVFLLFGIFILACGTTHLLDALMFWWPAYRLNALAKFFTAVVSFGTLIALKRVLPYAMALKSPAELEEIICRRTAELEESQRKLAAVNQELVQKNQELLRTNHDLDQFVYTASHDLKAPIANLEGLSQLLRDGSNPYLTHTESELLDRIGQSIGKLKLTVHDLTEIARVQKEIAGNTEELQFQDMLQDVLTDLAPLQAVANATITTRFQVPAISFARKYLRSILYNLVSNALKYRSPKRPLTITLSSYRHNNYIVLEVEDNGLGISGSHLPKVFTMFTRFHQHTEGTGIGLYIIKRILENSQGYVEVSSEEGQGTHFRIFFPDRDLSSDLHYTAQSQDVGLN